MENGDYRAMTAQDLLSTPIGVWWITQLRIAGIKPKHAPAHLVRNCAIFGTLEGKQKALGLAKTYTEDGRLIKEDRVKNSILLAGSVGTGKTWLATAVMKNFMWRMQSNSRRQIAFIWTTFSDMIRAIQGSYSDKSVSTESVIDKYKRARVLLIDDFGDMDASGSTDDKRSIVYEIIDSRNSSDRKTIFTTNLELGEMRDNWGTRTFERISEMCRYISMGGENMRRRKEDYSDDDRLITETMVHLQDSPAMYNVIPTDWYRREEHVF